METVARSFRFCCLFLSLCENLLLYPESSGDLKARDKGNLTLRNSSKTATPLSNRASELRSELAHKITFFMGSEENRATDIPSLTLHRRIAPTAPCSMTYEPGVTVIAQGRKRVDLGGTTFMYGEGQYLLTSVDLPIVSQIVEASEETPCLAMSLKLEMPVIRELLSREEMQVAESPSDNPAMATG